MRTTVLVVVLASCTTRSTTEIRTEIDGLVTKIRADLSRIEQARAAVVEVAIASLVARPDLGPCDVPIADGDREQRFVLVQAGAKLGPSPLLAQARKAVDDIALGASHSYRTYTELGWDRDEARTLSTQLASGYEVILVEDELVDATFVKPGPKDTKGTFVPGRFRGRAFMYSNAQNKVVCAAMVDAHSSPEVVGQFSLEKANQLTSDMNIALSKDLTTNAMAEAEAKMVVAGPR